LSKNINYPKKEIRMLPKKMEEALNTQINKEMYSGYLYMAMSAQCADMGLDGFAKWFMIQFHEEMFHAMKIYQYIQKRGGSVALKEIAAPPVKFGSVKEMFEKTLEHEKTVTKSIYDLVELAKKENDPATETFLRWYVTEQVEEEKNPSDILLKFRFAGEGANPGLLFLDAALKGRKLSVPSNFSEELS
jgi:ferritin